MRGALGGVGGVADLGGGLHGRGGFIFSTQSRAGARTQRARRKGSGLLVQEEMAEEDGAPGAERDGVADEEDE
jgi:hypothetical protein